MTRLDLPALAEAVRDKHSGLTVAQLGPMVTIDNRVMCFTIWAPEHRDPEVDMRYIQVADFPLVRSVLDLVERETKGGEDV